MPTRNTDLKDLTSRIHDDQMARYVESKKTLEEFLNDPREELVTETLHVLIRLRQVHPHMTFEWT